MIVTDDVGGAVLLIAREAASFSLYLIGMAHDIDISNDDRLSLSFLLH